MTLDGEDPLEDVTPPVRITTQHDRTNRRIGFTPEVLYNPNKMGDTLWKDLQDTRCLH